ncbi:hypothetical protein COCON_G00074690 [Conger conger]|uniref:Peptidase S54 rhomboid domain-containing protein n=1 Tax=Conger conger TaxID=82655 RepID=A0A9Q1DNC5_CONCO|nr:hypothetical protein COCON_G00074690 [Conger conger]
MDVICMYSIFSLTEYRSLGTSVVVNGHVHKLLTYSFFHKDAVQLLLGACVLVPFGSSLERNLGTVRFAYLLLLLSAWTGLMHTLLELLLFPAAERSYVQGFIPVSLSLLGMTTVHSHMRKAVLLGVSVPTAVLPWILLLFTVIIPDTVFLCNAIGILVGEIYGMGWFSLLDMSEARASVLDKKTPCRLLRTMVGSLYVPASSEERRKTLPQTFAPPPGSYPVQAYAPASSVPSAQAKAGPPLEYEGWQHSTESPRPVTDARDGSQLSLFITGMRELAVLLDVRGWYGEVYLLLDSILSCSKSF